MASDMTTDAFVRIVGIHNREMTRLLEEKRELQFRVLDLSQRILNAVGVLEEWEPLFADVPELKATIVRIREALGMGEN